MSTLTAAAPLMTHAPLRGWNIKLAVAATRPAGGDMAWNDGKEFRVYDGKGFRVYDGKGNWRAGAMPVSHATTACATNARTSLCQG